MVQELMTELENQHIQIHGDLRTLLSNWQECLNLKSINSSDVEGWIFFFNFLRFDHFAAEEKLFKQLLNSPHLNHGGPRCTYYMGLFLNAQMSHRRFNVLSKIIPIQVLESNLLNFPDWIIENSPLKIPLEEHLWVQNYHQAIIAFLKRLNLDSQTESFWLEADDAIQNFAIFSKITKPF